MMTSDAIEIPQSVLPSVVFEIPIEKTTGVDGVTLPPSIQKKLEELAATPRTEISLEDINSKLNEASKRKQDNLVNSKAATHNAKLLTVYEKTKEEEAEKVKALEEHIASKLANAEALKGDKTVSWVKKLSRSTKDKLKRGAKAKASNEWSSKELETKIEIKALAADLRREELKLKVQEEVAASNQDKLRRAQLAHDMAKAEAKHVELRSDLKLITAEQRREMNNALMLARLGEAAAEKRDKVDELRKQEEEAAKRSLADIEDKIKRAEERKHQALADVVESIATQTNGKLQRVNNACKVEEDRAKMKSIQIAAKVESANHRREAFIREQQDIAQTAKEKKERLFHRKRKEEQIECASKGKEIEKKLLFAAERKENIIAEKVQAVKDDHQAKEVRARETFLDALNESKELKKKSEKRLRKASKRKQQLLMEMVGDIQEANKKKSEKIDRMNRTIELEESQRFIATEKRLSAASANREHQLSEKLSSSKSKLLSPQSQSSSRGDDLDERMEQANLRREVYLMNKVEKAKKCRNSPINKELFLLSPQQGSYDGSANTPSVRVHSIDTDDDEVEKDVPRGFTPHYLIAISGVAIVFVAVISFLKAR